MKNLGEPIEVEVIDHTTDDQDGWVSPEQAQKSTPHHMFVRGYYVGEDDHILRVAFAKCGGSFSTIFNLIKAAIVNVQ